jgi:hypothetical protein
MTHPLNLTLDLYLQRMAARGAFDHLDGEGAPLDISGDAPSVIDKLLREADAKPVPVLLSQEIAALRTQLAATEHIAERRVLQKTIADRQTRLAIEIEAYNRFR